MLDDLWAYQCNCEAGSHLKVQDPTQQNLHTKNPNTIITKTWQSLQLNPSVHEPDNQGLTQYTRCPWNFWKTTKDKSNYDPQLKLMAATFEGKAICQLTSRFNGVSPVASTAISRIKVAQLTQHCYTEQCEEAKGPPEEILLGQIWKTQSKVLNGKCISRVILQVC